MDARDRRTIMYRILRSAGVHSYQIHILPRCTCGKFCMMPGHLFPGR